jgi:RimJ/RimL family protein N-acetyltransferase
MPITLSTPDDTEAIFTVYHLGIEFQKTVFHRHWFGFDRDLLVREISEGRHWKITRGPDIACVFSLLFEDPVVWGPKEPSLYLHRIVTNPVFKGNAYVPEIIDWAKTYGRAQGKEYIRLDTFPDNEKLMNYYVHCGFRYCGIREFGPGEVIPKHYRDGVSLFEMAIP